MHRAAHVRAHRSQLATVATIPNSTIADLPGGDNRPALSNLSIAHMI